MQNLGRLRVCRPCRNTTRAAERCGAGAGAPRLLGPSPPRHRRAADAAQLTPPTAPRAQGGAAERRAEDQPGPAAGAMLLQRCPASYVWRPCDALPGHRALWQPRRPRPGVPAGQSPARSSAPRVVGSTRAVRGRYAGSTRAVLGQYQGSTRAVLGQYQGAIRAVPGRCQGGARVVPGRCQGSPD